jgi:hypothetical protein
MSFITVPAVVNTGAPGANDDVTKGFAVGDLWVDSSASPRVAYTCTNNSIGAATWSSNGGGGGAPTNAQYLVVALDGTLTNERRLVAGSGITLNDGGAGGNFTIGTVGGGGAAGVGIGGFYGDGSDGALTVLTGTTYTQTAERHFTDVTIQGTGIFKPAGWLTFINGTLTIEASASYNDDGLNAFGRLAGAALAGNRGYLGATSGAGGNGAQTSSNGSFPGVAAAAITNASLNNFGVAPAGGKGGNSSGGTGGNGGAVTTQTRQRWRSSYPTLYGVVAQWTGGSGGGGGAFTNTSGLTGEGGGGGGGGGMVGLWARYISNSGRISANGGNGYEGYVANANGNAGGGGGGGGGLVCVTTDTAISSCGTITAAGGLGGAGFNPGAAAGSPGAAGNVVIISYGGS